ncbi:docking protein 2 [Genypterus blacodes]|uniref:docking protein 2 n=1 Tax=Genypterus blacodes TaxID=154954 RepID=UPI003F7610B3
MEVIFKEGAMHLQGVKFGKRTWRRMWMVLFKPSSSGVGRLELYTVQDTRASPPHKTFPWQKIAPKKVVRLCDCVSVTPATEESCPPGCTALYLCTTLTTLTLASSRCHDWLIALCQLAFQKDPRESDKGLWERGNGFLTMEDNELYSSWETGDTHQSAEEHHVIVQSTEASWRCRLDGGYLFSLDGVAALLLDIHTGDIIQRWPYKFLRKIGQFEGGFSLTAGRRCDSGEGQFIFLSNHGPHIYQAITEQCLAVKKSEDSSIRPANVHRSISEYSVVQFPPTNIWPVGPPVSEAKCVNALYATINKPAENVRRSSHVSPHVTISRETEGEENKDEDGWSQFPKAPNLESADEDCIYYNVRRCMPSRMKDQFEPEGDASEWSYSNVEILEPSSQLQHTPSSPSPSSSPLLSQPLPQCFSYLLPQPQHQHPAPFVKNETVGKMKGVEEATSLSPYAAPPSETPGSFKHRLAEIISKDLAKFQSPLPSGVSSPLLSP